MDALRSPQGRVGDVRSSPVDIPDAIVFGTNARSGVQQSNQGSQVAASPESQLAADRWLCLEARLEQGVVPSWTLGPIDIKQDVMLDLYMQ